LPQYHGGGLDIEARGVPGSSGDVMASGRAQGEDRFGVLAVYVGEEELEAAYFVSAAHWMREILALDIEARQAVS
jgi:hypothetical protein